MRILITGGSGTLGGYLRKTPVLAADELLVPSREELDVTDAAAVGSWMRQHRPELVLHCAAVIRARNANDPSMWAHTSRVNVLGTGHVARAAADAGARMLYVSTDFVFDGRKPGGMYREDDVPCPLGYYPLSKYAGERLALEHPDALVVRTSFCPDAGWPYPRAFTDRFTSKMLASRAASALVHAGKSDLRGVLHVGGPRRSYLELARTIDPSVEPMTLDDVEAGAELMPIDTSLDCSRWERYRSAHVPGG